MEQLKENGYPLFDLLNDNEKNNDEDKWITLLPLAEDEKILPNRNMLAIDCEMVIFKKVQII